MSKLWGPGPHPEHLVFTTDAGHGYGLFFLPTLPNTDISHVYTAQAFLDLQTKPCQLVCYNANGEATVADGAHASANIRQPFNLLTHAIIPQVIDAINETISPTNRRTHGRLTRAFHRGDPPTTFYLFLSAIVLENIYTLHNAFRYGAYNT